MPEFSWEKQVEHSRLQSWPPKGSTVVESQSCATPYHPILHPHPCPDEQEMKHGLCGWNLEQPGVTQAVEIEAKQW